MTMKRIILFSITLFLTMIALSSCDTFVQVKGTYTWDWRGYKQTIIISSNADTGPCIWKGEDGETSNESYTLYTYGYDRPQLDIKGIAYIDIKNRKVYDSESDFRAHRNGRPCTITR